MHDSEIQRSDGDVRNVQTLIFPIKTVHGYIAASVLHDITDRIKTEQALQDSEERFRSFVEESVQGIILLDEQGRIVEWNKANEHITGLTRAEVLGQLFVDVMMPHVDGFHLTQQTRR